MLIAGFLCALLLVAGSWSVKVVAVLSAAWFLYAQAAFSRDGHWAAQMEQTFDFTPFRVGGLVSVIALLAVAVVALAIAARPTAPYLTPGGAAATL